MAEVTEGLVYRGHPLRRVDNLIYYGSMADKYIVMMQVLDTTPLKDITLAKRVSIQLQMTDASLRSRDPRRPRSRSPRVVILTVFAYLPR